MAAKEKLQITMDSELLKAVDDYCDKNFMNRSWMISNACLQVVNTQKMIDSISMISIALQKCAELGTVDEDTRKLMQDFEVLSRMFVKGK